ncbi:MAG: beta-lactamase family protein [Bacteroidales bacterium]|nr:beta-lactamase family protein [Bacteroidales bacterium]
MNKIFILSGLIVVFFFGEIALTFSDKGVQYLIEDEEVAFSLQLDNEYSEFQVTEHIDIEVQDFMNKWRINGASVAISKEEELVYAKGFGYADIESGEKVKPGHLFRIASVSKLLTAVAIMKLYEEKKLDLQDFVFGPAGILDTSYFSGYKDRRYEDIKVVHLMNHTAGWSRRSGDPVFNSLFIARQMGIEPPVQIENVIEYTLSRKLYYNPGERYSYSNIGYAILGKVIEAVSGIPYEDYVILNILKPAGIHDMHIARSFQYQKYPNEVKYYAAGTVPKTLSFTGSGERVPRYYGGNNMELLAAAGGWVASAPELCKLLSVLDGFDGQPDILKNETLEMMTNPDYAEAGILGWRGVDNYGTWWRTGYLSGSTALVVRQQNQVNWVILMNTSTYKQSRIQRYVSSMMFSAINKVELWPYLNLFMVNEEYPDPISEIPENNPLL